MSIDTRELAVLQVMKYKDWNVLLKW